MTQVAPVSEQASIGRTVAHYVFWLVTAILAIVDAIFVRQLWLAAYLALRLSKWAYAFADKMLFVFVCLAALVLAFVAEGWYAKHAARGWAALLWRFGIVTAAQVGMILLAWLVA